MQYALQMKHYEECLDTLLICIIGKYPETAKKALKILMQFSTPYLHKLIFLTLYCVHIITVAMETQQYVPFLLLTYKILCTAVKNIKVLWSLCKMLNIIVKL